MLGGLLVLTALLLYAPVTHHEFISGWDDNEYITDNVHVRTGLSLGNVGWAFTSREPFYWHPLTWLSHMVDCQLFGLDSGWHHYVNVVLHAINALLLFLLLHRATGAVWRSFVVAALFAVHPLNVETVAWAAERKSLLGAFFSLVTIAAYGRYVQRPGWKRYLTVLGSFLMALMSKPTAVTLPFVLLLLDHWPLRRYEELSFPRRWMRLLQEKLPLLLMSVGVSAITLLGGRAGGFVVPLSVLPMSTRLENVPLSYVGYIGKMLWPANLAVFYPHPASILGPSLPLSEVAAATLLLAGITALVLYSHRTRYAAMGWLFFLATMVPMIGIVQVGYQGIQDHFSYIPCIGLFIALVWGIAAIAEDTSIKPAVPLLASLCVIAGFAAATVHYLHYWQNGVRLFGQARAAARQPHPWLEQLYANALLSSGQVDEALQHYKESCALGPKNEHCHYQIAEILFERRQFRDAINEYQLALMFTGQEDVALKCLNRSGEALLQLGHYDAAERSFAEALRIDPSNETALRLRNQALQGP